MIDCVPILKIIPIFTLALISPGPDFMLISSLALSRGRMAGILAAAGITMGNMIYIGLCMFGIGLLIAKLHWLAMTIRICGGAYLVYLGIQLWRASLVSKQEGGETVIPSDRKRNPFTVGLLTNLTNTKAMAFFTSIFAVTLSQDTNMPTQMVMVAAMLAVSFGWFSLVAVGLSSSSMRKVYMCWSKWIDRVSGTFLTLFGLRLMLSGQK